MINAVRPINKGNSRKFEESPQGATKQIEAFLGSSNRFHILRFSWVNGKKWIVGKRHKTGVPYQVKLLDVPLQIIERYRDYPKENPKSVFGEVNYWSVCKKLKPVMKECGIDKPIRS